MTNMKSEALVYPWANIGTIQRSGLIVWSLLWEILRVKEMGAAELFTRSMKQMENLLQDSPRVVDGGSSPTGIMANGAAMSSADRNYKYKSFKGEDFGRRQPR